MVNVKQPFVGVEMRIVMLALMLAWDAKAGKELRHHVEDIAFPQHH
jgi:hypothetical protein